MTSEQSTAFAANLRRLKDESGLTWLEIGHKLGHRNDRYILALASGKFEPRVVTVNSVARVFGVEPAEMLETRNA